MRRVISKIYITWDFRSVGVCFVKSLSPWSLNNAEHDVHEDDSEHEENSCSIAKARRSSLPRSGDLAFSPCVSKGNGNLTLLGTGRWWSRSSPLFPSLEMVLGDPCRVPDKLGETGRAPVVVMLMCDSSEIDRLRPAAFILRSSRRPLGWLRTKDGCAYISDSGPRRTFVKPYCRTQLMVQVLVFYKFGWDDYYLMR